MCKRLFVENIFIYFFYSVKQETGNKNNNNNDDDDDDDDNNKHEFFLQEAKPKYELTSSSGALVPSTGHCWNSRSLKFRRSVIN